MKRCKLFGVKTVVSHMEEAVSYVRKNKERLKGKYVSFANVHTTVTAKEEKEFRKVQNEAALVMPDGKPLSFVMKKRGYEEAEQIAGPDFMKRMWEVTAESQEESHYFYGAGEETIAALEEKLKAQYPNLKIAGMESPPYRELTEEEKEAAVKRINESGADYLWVGLGAPKQEYWMNEHKGKIHAVMFGVGAAFDFHAGTIKRAPKWMQKCYLEWFYRILQDPGRLWKRYAVTNARFILMVIGYGINGLRRKQ